MTGLLLGAVFLLWLAACAWLVHWIGKHLPHRWQRPITGFLIFGLLLPLPLIDEIVGARQFASLCNEHGSIRIDKQNAKGMTIYYQSSKPIYIDSLWVPVRLHPVRFVAPKTGEVVVSYETLHATGGWFIRALGISEGNVPLTFNDTCAPKENIRELFAALQITAMDKPVSTQKEN